MKRIIDQYLLEWKTDESRKSLLVRGARQIGKTYAIRQLGKTYKNFIEINFEKRPWLIPIFDHDFVPERIIKELSEKLKITIDTKDTLLFFDEIQNAPKVITTLGYFYEEMHDLHVIAAGSRIDCAIKKVGMPVGKIKSCYMYLASFLEFLWAVGQESLAQKIMEANADSPLDESMHQQLLKFIDQYIVVGGIPEVIMQWCATNNEVQTARMKKEIINSYTHDFDTSAKEFQIKSINDSIALAKSLEHLGTASIAHKFLSKELDLKAFILL